MRRARCPPVRPPHHPLLRANAWARASVGPCVSVCIRAGSVRDGQHQGTRSPFAREKGRALSHTHAFLHPAGHTSFRRKWREEASEGGAGIDEWVGGSVGEAGGKVEDRDKTDMMSGEGGAGRCLPQLCACPPVALMPEARARLCVYAHSRICMHEQEQGARKFVRVGAWARGCLRLCGFRATQHRVCAAAAGGPLSGPGQCHNRSDSLAYLCACIHTQGTGKYATAASCRFVGFLLSWRLARERRGGGGGGDGWREGGERPRQRQRPRQRHSQRQRQRQGETETGRNRDRETERQ